MANPREKNKSNARDIGTGRRRYDKLGRPPRGRYTEKPAHPVQRESHICKFLYTFYLYISTTCILLHYIFYTAYNIHPFEIG